MTRASRLVDALRKARLDRVGRLLLGERLHVRIASRLFPPPLTMARYDRFIAFCEEHRLMDAGGDVCEIGAWIGGGTRVLSAYAARHGRRVHVVDVFAQDFSERRFWNLQVYGADQWEAFRRNTRDLPNVHVQRIDSREATFPPDVRFSFALIDGNHEPEYVRSDFEKVWERLLPGGGIAFDDYGADKYRACAEEIDRIVAEKRGELSFVAAKAEENTMYLVRAR